MIFERPKITLPKIKVDPDEDENNPSIVQINGKFLLKIVDMP